MLNYFMNRASVRHFSDMPVSEELLRKITLAASHAPNTGNMQAYSIVITRMADVLCDLYPAHFNQPAATGAPILATVCVDFNRIEKWCRLRDAEPGFENFQSFIAGMLDAAIFAQQFCTIAELEGLGTCYLGTTTYNPYEIADSLKLPKRVVPVLTIALGYPDTAKVENKPTERLPVEAILHDGVYYHPWEQDINAFYKEKEALPENIQFVKENNKETLAQVFTDVRYTKENNEHFSKVFANFLKFNGFLEDESEVKQ